MINIERPWMKPISMMDGNEVMASRGFKLIGLKLYSPNDENAIYHAKMMQKSLYGREDWLYINDGFYISGDVENGFNVAIQEDAFDSEFLLYSTEHGVKVSISAIVGQNGTGKSKLVIFYDDGKIGWNHPYRKEHKNIYNNDTILHKIQTIQVLGGCQEKWESCEKRLGLSALCGRGIQPLGSV